MTATAYRPDIDGLRAVAVVSVVFFHAEFSAFGGGFVGVDVFFVISGFLITKIILSDIEKDKFSIVNFYERRIRRIFPALFAMMFAYMIVASLFLLPSDFLSLAESAVATTLFMSNFYFWTVQTVGYFVATPENFPLIHTWSLAVEEQFYIFYPVVIFALIKYAKNWVAVVVPVGFIASLLISIWAVKAHPSAAFYLAPARVWELLAGAILALGLVPALYNTILRNMAGLLGIFMIGVSVVAFSADTTPFPGFAALLPCIGTALVIHAGANGQTLVGRILSMRPVVFVGLISYSLYLWHWPLFAIAKQYFSVAEFGLETTAVVIASSVVLAILSWRFVERPFRDRARVTRRQIFVGGVAVMSLTIASGALVTVNAGFPQRFDDDVILLASGENDVSILAPKCESRKTNLCFVGAPDGPATFLFWGDSHAGALIPAVEKASADAGRRGLVAWRGGCPPLLEVSRISSLEDERLCPEFNDAVMAAILAPGGPDTVILSARWAVWAQGSRYASGNRRLVLIEDTMSDEVSREENKAVFARGLDRVLAKLTKAGKRVVIVGPVPEVGLRVPSTLAIRRVRNDQSSIAPQYVDFLKRQEIVFHTFRELAKTYSFELILPHEALCDNGSCRVQSGGRSLYQDSNHLSVFGALAINHVLDPAFFDPASEKLGAARTGG